MAHSKSNFMIETKKLVKRFGLKIVLRGVDFSVQPGEFISKFYIGSLELYFWAQRFIRFSK